MKGVVAAGHEVTANAAASILRGNAFDAALAGMLASGVAEFVLSSLGGGGFLMAHRADDQKTVLYDFFAQTPRQKRPVGELDFHAIHADFGPATQEFHIGAGSTATPGVIPGLFAVHRDLCTMPLERLVEPAVSAARDGVLLGGFQTYLFTVIEPILTTHPCAKELFAPKGQLPKKGELFRNQKLADTLEVLALEGERLFRQGELGQTILTQSIDHGGHLSSEDLASYEVKRRAPIVQRYRNHLIYLNPAPSAGGPLLGFGFGLLERLCKDSSPELTDLVTVMSMTNKARAAKTCDLAMFAQDHHIARHLAALENHPPSNRGTTHISVIDKSGNAASLTLSNGEGNGLMLGDAGFMLNNMLGEEDLHNEGFHRWPTNQRLSSMMAPTLFRAPDGSLTALGSGGSNRIRSALLQVVSGLVDHQFSLEQAVDAPRLHTEMGGHISFEDSPDIPPFSKPAKENLLATHPDAHAWPRPNMFFGGVHAVREASSGEFEGKGDPRRDGFTITVV